TYATSRTIIAAYQMVKAGETARSHRHTPNALRLVVDTGPEAYTVVDGQRIPMLPGDVLLTPNGAWHGHANLGAEDAVWIDFLDVPVVHFMEPMFFEHHPEGIEPSEKVSAASPWRFSFSESMQRLDDAPSVEGSGGLVRRIVLGPPSLDTM
ncbi:cupin domain-containing protein, partial [Escherichia coli]|uniref:cupin domain-containing protein n=1 Tax=Escherichia coli TaxID=562 RepID=UPI001365598E